MYKGGILVKKKLSALSALYASVLLVIASTLNVFAYDTSISTGDSTTTLVVALSIILVVTIVAILFLSKKR